jgi:hypothetical protein
MKEKNLPNSGLLIKNKIKKVKKMRDRDRESVEGENEKKENFACVGEIIMLIFPSLIPPSPQSKENLCTHHAWPSWNTFISHFLVIIINNKSINQSIKKRVGDLLIFRIWKGSGSPKDDVETGGSSLSLSLSTTSKQHRHQPSHTFIFPLSGFPDGWFVEMIDNTGRKHFDKRVVIVTKNDIDMEKMKGEGEGEDGTGEGDGEAVSDGEQRGLGKGEEGKRRGCGDGDS